MNSIKILYSPFGVIFIPIISILGGFIGPVILEVLSINAINRGKTGATYVLIGASIVCVLLIPYIYLHIRCLFSYLKKEPAIELTSGFYIDNTENVKIAWKDISKIWTITFNSSFLKVTPIANSIIYNQAKNPIWKFIFWNNAWNGGILSINLSLLKGKNRDIVNMIKEYHQGITKNSNEII